MRKTGVEKLMIGVSDEMQRMVELYLDEKRVIGSFEI